VASIKVWQRRVRDAYRQLLTFSLVGQGLCMLVLAAGFTLKSLASSSGPIALAFTILYVLAFALGSGPVPGLLCAELLPTSIRGALCHHDVSQLHAGALHIRDLADG
jgi:Sugar (and other) transporter